MVQTSGTEEKRDPDRTPIATGDDEATEVAVIGVGNEIMGDDGVGARVIDRLEASEEGGRQDITLSKAGTTAFFALEAMSGCDKAIIVDAIDTGDDPGTLHQFRYEDGVFAGDVPEMTMHDFSFVEALRAGREAYDIPPVVHIIGVEPARIEMSLELSEPIEECLPALVDQIRAELPDR